MYCGCTAGAAGAAGSAPHSTAKSHLHSCPLVNPAENSISGHPAATKRQGGVVCTDSAAFSVRGSFFDSIVSISTVGHNRRSQLLGAAVISRSSFLGFQVPSLPSPFQILRSPHELLAHNNITTTTTKSAMAHSTRLCTVELQTRNHSVVKSVLRQGYWKVAPDQAWAYAEDASHH
jgi:hypothetical protein